MEIQWEDPPDKRRRTGKWSAIFAELRKNYNRWAKLSEGKDRNSHSLAGRLRAEYNKDNEFEIISQTTEPIKGVKQAGVWARYIIMPDGLPDDPADWIPGPGDIL